MSATIRNTNNSQENLYNFANISALVLTNTTTITTLWREFGGGVTVWVAVMMSFCSIGVVLNTLLFLVIVLNKELRSTSGTLIAHQIFVEMTLCGIHYPLYVLSAYYSQIRPISMTFCRYANLFYYMAIHASFFSALALSINRFVAVIFPHHYRKMTSRGAIIATLVLTHLIPVSLNLPLLVGWGGSYGTIPPWNVCGNMKNIRHPDFLNPLLIALNSQIPIVAIGIINVLIYAKLTITSILRRRSVMPDILDEAARRQNILQQRRVQLAKILFVSYLWYLCCFVPPSVVGGFFKHMYVPYPLMQFWIRGMQVFSYSINPVIFFSMNKDYRTGLKYLIGWNKVEPVTEFTGQSRSRGRFTWSKVNTYNLRSLDQSQTRDNRSSRNQVHLKKSPSEFEQKQT